MDASWGLTIDERLYRTLMEHLFPGDRDEHGAVMAAGIVSTVRGTRLLARELFKAEDGVDFVPGRRGYRMLTPEFVGDRIRFCRDQGLIYLAIHNHGGHDQVEFSDPDNRSHDRGYPALLDISGRAVGALVFAEGAVAGDIWTPDRARRAIRETVIVGRNIARLYPVPPPRPPEVDPTYDRQARWFGDRGQALLAGLKVGVIGAGGVGLPLVAMLARVGVAALVGGEQVALFRLDAEEITAIGNLDPYSGANVLSRGIVGSRGEAVFVASPMYKQPFDLRTGQCLEDPAVSVPTFDVRVVDGAVQVLAAPDKETPDG